jgi:hypothetical protein
MDKDSEALRQIITIAAAALASEGEEDDAEGESEMEGEDSGEMETDENGETEAGVNPAAVRAVALRNRAASEQG